MTAALPRPTDVQCTVVPLHGLPCVACERPCTELRLTSYLRGDLLTRVNEARPCGHLLRVSRLAPFGRDKDVAVRRG